MGKVSETVREVPLWLKCGLSLGILMVLLFSILPQEYTNLAYMPWFMGILIFVPFFLLITLILIVTITNYLNFSFLVFL